METKYQKIILIKLIESSSSTINQLNKGTQNILKKNLESFECKKKIFLSKIPITILTLDSFVEKNNIENIDLIKIDTEGYELNVLKGLSKLVKKVKLIYFEHHYDDMIIKDYKFRDIHKLLNDKGFKMIKKK